MRESIAGRLIGSSVKRVEDPRILTGAGRYVDDITVPRMLHAAFLRSPFPHARIVSIDAREAGKAPGVVAVVTGRDLERITTPLMGFLPLPGLVNPVFHALAVDRVRFVGDPVALVIAESRYLAEDARQLIDVQYEPLDPVATIEQALAASSPRLWDEAGGNVMFRSSHSYGEPDAVFAEADRVISATFRQHRHANMPMETRGAVAEVDPVTREVTYHAATQSPHMLELMLRMSTRRLPLRRVWGALRRIPRLRGLLRTARASMGTGRSLGALVRQMLPSTLKQLARHPSRLVHMTRMSLPLLLEDRPSVRVRAAADIGGAFGVKGFVHREDVALCAAARHLGRSIKWIEDRSEHLAAAGQAREETMEVEAGVLEDGTLLGLRVRMTMDQGAYPALPFPGSFFTAIVRTVMPGPYRLRAYRFDATVVATNKASYVAYRGPWEVETWARERMLDVIARELGLDRAEVHLRNMVGPDELPARMITGPTLDERMSAKRTLERALELSGYERFAEEQRRSREQGRYPGIGFATYIEAAPGPPDFMDHVMPGFGAAMASERARVRIERDGSVTVITSQSPHGQGHETTLAQVAADELGVRLDSVRVVHGDTRVTPFSMMGTGGSRSAAMAGGAVLHASREVKRRVLRIASALLEAATEDLEVADGAVSIRGAPDRSMPLADIARVAAEGDGLPPGTERDLDHTASHGGGSGGWSQATHVCWVEVDPRTWQVRIPRYLVVEDCGRVINPAVVEGQVRGGVAQGIGAVLYERSAYDEAGQLMVGTFMDYLVPTSMEIPEIEIDHVETPSEEDGFRGVGEGGAIGAPAALTNAIEDALTPFGVRITDQYLPPSRILELIEDAKLAPERTRSR